MSPPEGFAPPLCRSTGIRCMNETRLDAFEGCLLGLALGDAMGAPYEGGPVERLLWRIIGRTRQGEMRWTDDTQMALDIAESLIAAKTLVGGTLDADDLAARFAGSYRWSRGYGPAAAKLLRRIGRGQDWRVANRSVYPEGSFGNGGAMRVPVIGVYFAENVESPVAAARLSASVTHAHPLAIEGAVLVAAATGLAAQGRPAIEIFREAATHCRLQPFSQRIEIAANWLAATAEVPPPEVRRQLGNGIAASESCVTAIYIAARFLHSSFAELLQFTVGCGGDVDTLAAMAGGVWGAKNGATQLPADKLAQLEQCERIRALAGKLDERKQLAG